MTMNGNEFYALTEAERLDRTFDYFEVDGCWSKEGINRNLEAHYENKADLIDLLRKHPKWDEQRQAVILTAKDSREFDRRAILNAAESIYRAINGCPVNEYTVEYRALRWVIVMLQGYVKTPLVSSEDIGRNLIWGMSDSDLADVVAKYRIRAGQKWSRVARKIFAGVVDMDGNPIVNAERRGDEWMHEFESEFAKLADALNPLTVDRMMVLSVNYVDYLTASHGNSWCSCHYINSDNLYHDDDETYHGMYKGGTLSYANDSVSLVFYVIPSDANEDDLPFCWQRKIRRNMFHYADGLLLQGRVYPCSGNTAIRDEYGSIVQQIIAECEDQPNLWKVECKGVSKHFFKDDYALCYPDWQYTNGSAGTYECVETSLTPYLSEHNIDLDGVSVYIGSDAYDINNAECLDDHEILTTSGVRRCCYHCEEYFCEDDGEQVNGDFVCNECLERHYYRCDHCGDWVHEYDICDTDDEYHLCNDCYADHTWTCEHCGETYYENGNREGYVTEDSYTLCSYCYGEHTETCAECGETYYRTRNNGEYIGEDWYCCDCAEEVHAKADETEEEETAELVSAAV